MHDVTSAGAGGDLTDLFRRLQSCRRLINAAGARIRVASGGEGNDKGTVPSHGAMDVRQAVGEACEAFRIRRPEVGPEVISPSAVERVVAHRLALAEHGGSWGAGNRLDGAAVRRAIERVHAEDPVRMFTEEMVQSPRGARLRVYQCGRASAPPWLLVLPYGIPVEMSFELARELSREYRFVTFEGPDLLGDPDAFDALSHGVDQTAADIVAVMNHLGLSRVTVAGMCAGAMPTLRFASRHVDRVASVILGNAAYATKHTPRTQFETDFIKLVRHVGGQRDKARLLFKFVSVQDLVQIEPECSHLTMLPYASPEMLYTFMTVCQKLYGDELEETELNAWLAAIDRPIFVFVGDRDTVAHPDGSRLVSKKLKHSVFFVEPGGTHLSPFRAPSRGLVDALLRFPCPSDR